MSLALGQLMLFVDGMLGVVAHSETVQWLYTLCASLSRLVVKTALKLLLVFVEYSETNAPLFIQAVNAVASTTGQSLSFPFSATQPSLLLPPPPHPVTTLPLSLRQVLFPGPTWCPF